MSDQPAPGVYQDDQLDTRIPDLSSLSEEQRSAVAYMAQREAAALIRRVMAGANDRIVAAIRNGGMVLVPIFHLDDVARIEANWSSGKATHVSDEASA